MDINTIKQHYARLKAATTPDVRKYIFLVVGFLLSLSWFLVKFDAYDDPKA